MTTKNTNTSRTYGYCRISRREQNIDRQIRNIQSAYPEAQILTEAFTGTKTEGRKEFEKLIKIVKRGDTIVFDSVSRMSRNAEEGIKQYKTWFDMGVSLVFLKEGYINTSVYASKLQQADISTGKTYLDEGLKVILMGLAEEQIMIAFEQAQKEVDDLHQRTREGIETARIAGKQIGQKTGTKLTTKKSIEKKQLIKEKSRDFWGTYIDEDLIKVLMISRNTFYKYKREIREELIREGR